MRGISIDDETRRQFYAMRELFAEEQRERDRRRLIRERHEAEGRNQPVFAWGER